MFLFILLVFYSPCFCCLRRRRSKPSVYSNGLDEWVSRLQRRLWFWDGSLLVSSTARENLSSTYNLRKRPRFCSALRCLNSWTTVPSLRCRLSIFTRLKSTRRDLISEGKSSHLSPLHGEKLKLPPPWKSELCSPQGGATEIFIFVFHLNFTVKLHCVNSIGAVCSGGTQILGNFNTRNNSLLWPTVSSQL